MMRLNHKISKFLPYLQNKFHASGNSDDDSHVKNFHSDALRLNDVDDDYYDHDDVIVRMMSLTQNFFAFFI